MSRLTLLRMKSRLGIIKAAEVRRIRDTKRLAMLLALVRQYEKSKRKTKRLLIRIADLGGIV